MGTEGSLLLLTLYAEPQDQLSDKKTRKARVWDVIGKEMKERGYDVMGKQCNSRWKTLKALFRRMHCRPQQTNYQC